MNTMNLNVTRRNASVDWGPSSPCLGWKALLPVPYKNAALPRRFVGMYTPTA